MQPEFAPENAPSLPLWLVTGDALPDAAGDAAKDWARASGFDGKPGSLCLLPGEGGLAGAVFGVAAADDRRRDPFALAAAAKALPEGAWHIAAAPEGFDGAEGALAWLFAQYVFDRYKPATPPKARLVCPQGVDAARLIAVAQGEFLTRDLINTPANEMGPDALEQAAADLAARHGFEITTITGDALLEANFPLIHTVGGAGAIAPRLIELRNAVAEGPLVTLVGKGVCFDTGGLNLKPGASMGLMKKDMGGAATVLGLTEMLAATGAADGMRLRVLIPAVENAVAGNAFRPGDVLRARNGRTVEVNNTDAEGRLVLADALAYAGEEAPDWMISMATLTGAARVALGPDIPPFYCDDDDAAAVIGQAAMAASDPLWRMPFWDGYEAMIEPAIADLDNAPSGGMAGSITAALFLRRFAGGAARYAHFDIYGWRPTARPGRPKGGIAQGARALLEALPRLLA